VGVVTRIARTIKTTTARAITGTRFTVGDKSNDLLLAGVQRHVVDFTRQGEAARMPSVATREELAGQPTCGYYAS